MKNKIFEKILNFIRKDTTYQQFKKDIGSTEKAPATEEFEHCVICGKLTCVPISMPVDWRENYEIGVGQICAECAKKQREATIRENILTNAQIMLAVEQSRKSEKPYKKK
jgi:hypothetical protein